MQTNEGVFFSKDDLKKLQSLTGYVRDKLYNESMRDSSTWRMTDEKAAETINPFIYNTILALEAKLYVL